MRRLAATSLWAFALLLSDGASSQAADEVSTALALVSDGDPLEIARIVSRAGDDAILALLAADAGPGVNERGITAARWLLSPESALPRLAELAAGRDPDLAPAAAREAQRICAALERTEIAGRDTLSAPELLAVLDALRNVAQDPSARPDIRRLAALAADELAAEAPAPPSP